MKKNWLKKKKQKDAALDAFGRINKMSPNLKSAMPVYLYDSTKVTTSSNLSDEFRGENVLKDDNSEWASNGDHKDAWIKLEFPERFIKLISYADRKINSASMVLGTLSCFLRDELVFKADMEVNGAGSCNTIKPLHGFSSNVDCITIKASDRSWGKNIGLSYLNIS